jgi:hypothetical protein
VESHISRKTSEIPEFPTQPHPAFAYAVFLKENSVKFLGPANRTRKFGVWGTRGFAFGQTTL